MMNNEKIGYKIRVLRTNIFVYRLKKTMFEKHIPAKQIWETTDIARTTMQAYVRGRVPSSWGNCVTLANALGVTTDYLFGEDVMQYKETFGEYLKKELKKRGWTYGKFSEISGISKGSIKSCANGDTPKTGMFKKYAKALGCTEEELKQKFTCTEYELMQSDAKMKK